MIDYISGKITELTPTRVVVDNDGIGYAAEISLQTFALLENKSECKVYVQTQINPRDGITVDYGFATKDERALFQLITGVSGIGAASARMVLSSLSAEEQREAILSENLAVLKGIKGIGGKTAERLVLELKDKLVKGGGVDTTALFQAASNEIVDEAVSALTALGFSKPNINKAIQKVLKANPGATVEQLIRSSLQIL